MPSRLRSMPSRPRSLIPVEVGSYCRKISVPISVDRPRCLGRLTMKMNLGPDMCKSWVPTEMPRPRSCSPSYFVLLGSVLAQHVLRKVVGYKREAPNYFQGSVYSIIKLILRGQLFPSSSSSPCSTTFSPLLNYFEF